MLKMNLSSDTDKGLQNSAELDNSLINREEEKDTYYTESISKKAVGRLFNDYVKIEGDEPAVNAAKDSTELGAVIKESVKEDEHNYDVEYIEYINSMADSTRKEKPRHLIQPEAVKQLTQKQKIVKREGEIYNARMDYSGDNMYDDIGGIGHKRGAFPPFSKKTSFLGVGGIVVLLMFTFFVITINSTNAKLQETEKNLASAKALNGKYNDLAKAHELLQQEVAVLTDKNNLLEEQSLASAVSNADDSDIDSEDPLVGIVGEDQPLSAPVVPKNDVTDEPTQGYKYTVKKGDTLYKIAKKAYGNSDKYKEIMSVNNIVNEKELRVGMDLIIP